MVKHREQPSLVNAPKQLLKDYILERMRKEGLKNEHIEFFETERRGVHTHQYDIQGKEYSLLFELDWRVADAKYKQEHVALIEEKSESDFTITFDGHTAVLDNLCTPKETMRVIGTAGVDRDSVKKVLDHIAKAESLERMTGKNLHIKDPIPFLNHYLDIFVQDYQKRTD